MINNKKINVLIVDDSLFFRTAISRGLSKDVSLNVVDFAANANEALQKIKEKRPDVITLDIEMPGMNGIEFLRKYGAQINTPVVVVSAVSGIVFEALRAGAVDFVAKASSGNDNFIKQLATKIKIASHAKLVTRPSSATYQPAQSASQVAPVQAVASRPRQIVPSNILPAPINQLTRVDVIAIGASTGGTEATVAILKQLPNNLPPILVTQHMPPVFTNMYAQRLDRECSMRVKEAENGDLLKNGWAYIAPGDAHLRVERQGGRLIATCKNEAKVSGHCPSVDVLFESVATTIGSASVGIILTGMGADGARGLLDMRNKGSFTIGQDQRTCVVYGMPMVAHKMGAVVRQAALENIHAVLLNHLKGK